MNTTKVYSYGLRPPVENAELVAEQLRLGHRYRNRLIEIERSRRSAHDDALSSDPEMHATEEAAAFAEAAKLAVERAVRDARADSRSRSETTEQRRAVAEAKAVLKQAWTALKATRKAVLAKPEIIARLDEIAEEAAEQVRQARAACGVHWGSYLVIEAAAQAAAKDSMKTGSLPAFVRWTGDGMVAVQIQSTRPLSTAEVFRHDTRLRIDPVPDSAWERRRASEQRTILRLRVGSDGRAPIWAAWPMIMHRPLPEGRITWAKVLRRRIECHDRWEVHLTVEEEQPTVQRSGAVAIDLGWRKRTDGIRTAYAVGSDSTEGEITTPVEIGDRLRKIDDLRSIRDKNRDVLRAWLHAWLKERADRWPDWLREWRNIRYLYEWQSNDRFARLAIHWRANRWEGDAEAFERIEAWRRQDKHLWTWEANLRDKVLRRRREGFRVVAAQLAERYGVLVLEDIDLRQFQQHQPLESGKAEIAPQRQQQRTSAPSELRLCLTNAFLARGGRVVKVDPDGTSQICHLCGHADIWPDPAALTHVCSECGAAWDRDSNAGHNILQRWLDSERPGATPKQLERIRSDSAKLAKREARWSKAKANRSKNGAEHATVSGPPQ